MFLFWIRLYFHLSPSLPGPFVLWCFSSVKSYKSLHNAIELLMLYRHQDHLSLFTAHWRKMPYSAKWAGSVRYSEYIYIQRRHEQAHTPTHTHTHTHTHREIPPDAHVYKDKTIEHHSHTHTHTHTHTHSPHNKQYVWLHQCEGVLHSCHNGFPWIVPLVTLTHRSKEAKLNTVAGKRQR